MQRRPPGGFRVTLEDNTALERIGERFAAPLDDALNREERATERSTRATSAGLKAER